MCTGVSYESTGVIAKCDSFKHSYFFVDIVKIVFFKLFDIYFTQMYTLPLNVVQITALQGGTSYV
jgi:hypothetical protein